MSGYNKTLVGKIRRCIKKNSTVEDMTPLVADELNIPNRWATVLLKTLREFKIIEIGHYTLDSSLASSVFIIKIEPSIYEASRKVANIAGIKYEEAIKKLRILAMFKIFSFVDYEKLEQEEKAKKEKHSVALKKIRSKKEKKEGGMADNLAFIRTCLNQKKAIQIVAVMLSDAMGIPSRTTLSYLYALKRWGLISYGVEKKFAFEKYYYLAEKCSDECISLEDTAKIISREMNKKLSSVTSMVLALSDLGILCFSPITRKKEIIVSEKIVVGRYKDKLPIPIKKEKDVIIRDTSGELKFKRGINVDPDSCQKPIQVIKVKESEENQINPYAPLK